MAGTTDFVPFATAAGANVTSQADYIAEGTTTTGYESGEASSADCNKTWRQGAFQAAVLANFVANALGINVPDDGNLANAITNLINAVIATASNATNLTSGTLSAARLPVTIAANTTGNAATATSATSAASATTAANAAAVTANTVTANLSYEAAVGVSGGGGGPTTIGLVSTLQINPSTGVITMSGSVTSTGYYISSDMTDKENIQFLAEDDSLRFICSLDGFTHNYLNEPGVRRAGLSAQQIKAGRPEAVSTKKTDDGEKLVREVGGLDADLAMAIRALTRRVTQLEAQLAARGEP